MKPSWLRNHRVFDLEHMGHDIIVEDAEDSDEDEWVVPEQVSKLFKESDEPRKRKSGRT